MSNVLLTLILFIPSKLFLEHLHLKPGQIIFSSKFLEKCNGNKFEQHVVLELLFLV